MLDSLYEKTLENKMISIMDDFYILSIGVHSTIFDFAPVVKIILTECEEIKEIDLLTINRKINCIELEMLKNHCYLEYFSYRIRQNLQLPL